MTLYLDQPIHRHGRMKMAHMTADTLEELHAAADCLDMKRNWRRAIDELGAELVRPRVIATKARALGLQAALQTPKGLL